MSFCSLKNKRHLSLHDITVFSLYTPHASVGWITHQALQGWPQPAILSVSADTNHVWLASSRMCRQDVPLPPIYRFDLCDPAGWPLTPRHMISVCDLWPIWIIKEARPRGDGIGNPSMVISDLAWGKRVGVKATDVFWNADAEQSVCVCVCACL